MVPRDGFEPPQSKTTDLQSAYLTNESPGLFGASCRTWTDFSGVQNQCITINAYEAVFGTGARIRTLTNSFGDCHATVTSHPYIKTKTTFVLSGSLLPLFVFSVNGDLLDRPNVDLVLINFSHKKRSCPNYTRTDENLRMLRSAPHKTNLVLYTSSPGDLECLHATDVTWKRIYKCQQIRY